MKSFNHNIFLGKGFLPRLAIITLSLILLGITSTAQVRVPFEPRSSEFTPNKTTYSIKGDFTMIGNTNLTLRRYADNKNNSQNDMIYVDKDTDGGTQNSSSANLQFSTENGAFPECSNVIYAGLYWTGRMDYGYSLNSTERLAMRTVKFKAPGGSYQTLQANDDEIRYPGDNDMYAGYIEVTDIVKNAGEGEYWLADIALSEGNGGSTGYYGGWGLVVVYENSKMKWRDITVFDGYAYVQGSTANHTLEVSGFNTVQAGPNGEMVPVDIKMGFMAGEGDVGISGDYFEIQKQVDNSYMRLSHTGNTTENFFNSSIETGGNLRNPNLPNNTGLDISMFNVVNTDNEVIANSQTSTRFRYGSTQDTYVIFSIVFAVDAYIPETEAIVTNTAINGVPNPVSLFTDPGHILDIEVELKNKGTEATDNTLIVIPIPYTASFVENSISSAMYPPLTSSNAAPVFDPNLGATGSIVWDIGNFPLPSDPDDLLASISFQLKATEDCSILINPNCTPRIAITGTTSGVGATTGTPFEHGFIQGHETSGNCVGEPIPSPLYIDFDDDAVGKHCTGDPDDYNRKFYYCNRDGLPVQVAEVEAHFPPGSRFYNEYPIDDQSTEFTADNPFPAKTGTVTYYAIPPGITNCFFVFDIIIDDVRSTPTVNDVDYCLNDAAVALNATPSNSSYNLYYYTDNNPSTTAQTSIIPSTANAGQTTYYVAEGLSNACISPNRVPIIVSVIAPPSCEITGSSSVCPSSTNNIYSAPAGMDSYSWSITSGTATINAASDAQTVEVIAGSCNEDFTLELTVTNSNECSSTCSLDVEVEDNIAPTFDATPGNLTASCIAPAPYADYTAFVAAGGLVSDNCALNTASFTHVGDVSDNNTCEPTIQRTYRIFDACGLSVDYVQEISIDIPMFTPAADGGSTVNCLVDAQIEPTPPTVYDYCGNLITPVLKTTPADIACEGDMVWVFTYTDCAGNTDDWNYTYTIDIPMFTPAADGGSTVNCLIDAQIEPTPPTVYDYCGNLITPVLKTTPADIACEGDMVWVFTYTDCAGNSDDWNYTYTIDIPMFTPAADGGSTVNCLVDAQIEPTPPTVYDYCGNLITPVLKTTPADIACEGDMVWVFTYTDCAGNTDDWNYTYTIDIPMFTPAADGGSTVNCLVDAQIEPTPPTVYDYCGNLITPVLKTTPADIACEGDMVWVFTYTDCAGNSDDWNYTYTIDIPMFTPAADGGSTVNCLVDAQIEPTPPTVYDYCGNLITPVLKTTPADIACEGDMVWVFTYTDCAGNTDDWNYTYTIDIPMFTPAADGGSTVNCLIDAQIEPTPPTVYDYCGNLITPVLKTTPADIACEGDMVWVFTYTDCAGNSDDWNYTYTIDIPMFTPAADGGSTVNCLVDAQIEPTPPTVYDYCGNLITPVLKTTPADIACEGDMVWVFTYTDCAGNTDDWNYTYTIDIPMFTPAADGGSTVNCLVDAQIEPTPPTVYDYCGNLITPVLKTTPADIACEGDMVWVFTYTDCAGNSDDWNYTYTIDIPMFTPAADGGSTVNCLVDAQIEPTPPTVYDYCGNLITPVLKTTPADIACEGDMVWVFTYTDCAGNTDDWNYTYTIDIPMFTPAADGGSTVNCLVDAQIEPTPPTVYDYCGNLITPVLKTTPADIACEGDMVWVFTYTDCAGNSDDWNYTYTIDIPMFTPAADGGSTVNCLVDAQIEPTPPTVYDYCGNLITPVLKTTPADIACEGDMVWVFTYTDCAGNSDDWNYTYTIDIPMFTPAADGGSTVNCLVDAQVEPTPPTVYDYCGNLITPVLKTTPADIACEGDMVWVFTYTDCAGNSDDWNYTYTIDIPMFTPAADGGSTVNCLVDAQIEPTPPTVYDYCGNLITPVLKTTPADIACEGDMVWVFTYTDCAGNSDDWNYTYTIDIPMFTPAADGGSTVNCLVDAQVEPTPPTVYDYCGNLITPVLKTTPADIACEGDMVWVFTYTDCAGNSDDWNYTYTIDIPMFTPAADGGSTVNCLVDAQVEPTPPTVYDYCGNLITPVLKTTPADIACEGDMVWVFTYTDCAGNSDDWNYTYTIDIPMFTPAADGGSTVNCLVDAQIEPTPPTVYDYCGNLITPVLKTTPADIACEGDMVWVFTYTDCAGNSDDWNYTYTIDIPMFTPAADGGSTVNCLVDAQIEPTPPTVYDYCGNLITPVLKTTPADIACEGDMVWVFTYTDCAGNSDDWNYTYTIDIPMFTPAADGGSTVNCLVDAQVEPTPPTVYDYCGNLITPVLKTTPADIACEGDMVWVFTYTDCAGNSDDWNYTYTIDIPMFTPAADGGSTVNCLVDAQVEPTPPTVYDYCGNLITPVLKTTPADIACEGDMVWVFTYTDCAGNSDDWNYTYTIVRADFTMPENESETVNDLSEIYEPNNPTVYDYCGKLITDVTGPVISESPDCEGAVTYTWTYTDCSGKFSHDWIYTFTIDRIDFTVPEDDGEIISCIAELYTPQNPSVNDAYGNPITNVTGPVVSENPACEGDVTYVWTYTDCSGKFSHDWTYTFTIEREDFIMPQNTSETVACVADFEGVTPPEVTDACGNLLTPVAAEAPVAPACEGDMVYTWTYTDCEGNSHDWSHTVTIEREDFIMPDNTSETVACVADFEGVTPPEVTDACGNLITPVAAEAPVAPACEGDMVYTWTYTDCEGNSHDWSHTVTIEREDFIMPENTSETVACVADFEGVTPPEVTDACGNLITPVAAEAPVAPACEGDMVYTWTYTDCEGNSHDWSHTVTIEREDFIMPQNTSETVACVADFEGVTPPVVTDACGNLITPVAAEAPVAPACEGDMVYTWTYTDCEGNSHDWSHTVTIEREDFIMPENTSETVACVADFEGVTPPVVTDACGNLITPVAAEAPVAPACEGDMVYTWTYTDCKGNSHDWSHTVTIEREDFIMPENTSETVACVADFEGVTPPVVTDACGNLLTPVAAEAPVAPACEGDMVYTWTYTDCKGNAHDWSHTVTIEREDFIMPENTSETVACAADFEGVTPPEVTDACGNLLTPVAAEAPVAPACEGNMVYTWTYTDCKGNSHDWSHTVTIEREDFIMPENTSETVACVADFEGVTPPEVTDACGNLLTPIAAEAPVAPACEGDMVYTWTYTDCEGNSHDWSHTVNIKDEIAPTFNETLPLAEITAECDDVAEAVVLTAADNCDADVPVEFTETRTDGNCENSYTLTRVWTATDDCGNETSFTQTVTVSDNTAPTFNETLPLAEITAECDDVAEADVLTAADNCDTDVPVEFTETRTDGNCANSYTLTRVWTATDDCGNETSFTQTVTVSDNTAPAFNETLPLAEITAECDDVAEAVVLTAADNCDSDVPVVFEETRTDGNCENSYTLTRTWTATDDCGNETSFTQTVTVSDNTAPAFNETLPLAEITAECDDVAEAVVLTAADNCDSDVPVVFEETRTDGNCENSYTLTRTWTATDDCGNETSFTQTVTVSDNTAPTFNETLPIAEITAECDDVTEAVVLTAADNCDSDVPVVFEETRTDGNCENSYTLTRTWTATDDCGNETSFTQTVTVSDNTAPTFNETLPTAEVTAECDDVAEAVVLTAADNCDSDVPVEFTETRTDGNCANSYTLTRVWTATDDCGNETSFTQIVTVSDNTAPTFNETLPTAEITAECDDVAEAVVLTATDNCDSDVPVEFTETRTDGNCANSYTLTRTWTATDDCGNETSFTQIVTVSDNTAPEVTCNDITVQLDANGVATITVDDINGGATDNCGTIATMFISQETFNCDNVGENQVTLTAIDGCGNEATCTATVTVEEGDADCGFDPFKANDDILTLIYCPGETVSGDLDLFANDEGFTRENVSFTILTDLPNGVSATDGNLLYVNEQPTEAVITFTYSVCHTVNTENCDTAEVTIVVLLDTDCDGVPNNDDIDDDDDGILDIIEEENALDQTSLDSDEDGIVDRLDIDSDNDGIVDNIEWQSTIAEDGEYDYILPLGIDSNGDGWDDAYDPTSNGITYEPWDMDLDGTPDYLDTDTDSEGEDDNVEGWDEFPNDSIADVSFIGSDADGDGLDDAYDTYNTTVEGWTRGQNAIGSNAYLQDTDADGVRDWRDAVDDRTPPEQFACGEPVIPNAFSPNQDGYNDYFKVMIYCTGDQGGSEERVLGDDFNDARIEIFNRWGNLVYEQERYGNESYWGDVDAWWDGSSMHDMQLGNNQLPTATYYYILYFNDGSREPITGFVFLNN